MNDSSDGATAQELYTGLILQNSSFKIEFREDTLQDSKAVNF